MAGDTERVDRNKAVVLQLLHADDYWSALCSIKCIDEKLAGGDHDEYAGDGPQTPVASALLRLLTGFELKQFSEVWNDYETALASGAPDEIERSVEAKTERS